MITTHGTALLYFWIFWIAILVGGVIVGRTLNKRSTTSMGRNIASSISLFFLLGSPIFGLVSWFWMVSYVIEIGDKDHIDQTIIGPCDYTTRDGQKIHINPNGEDYYIVNNTDRMMMNKYVMYGVGFDFGGGSEFAPHTYITDINAPDLYPWHTPPETVTVTEGTVMDGLTWIYFQDENPEGY